LDSSDRRTGIVAQLAVGGMEEERMINYLFLKS